MKCNLRGIIETDRFQREKEDIEPDVRRMDDALDGITWTLAHDPTVGDPDIAPDVWGITTNGLHGGEELVIYYTFDDENVTLLSIEPASPS